MNIKPGGFSEAGISTRNLEAWLECLVETGGYEVIWRGESPDAIKPLWGISMDKTVLECLLGKPGINTGYIRLFQYENIIQEEIRNDTNTWDSGGIFDLDIRVLSVMPYTRILKEPDWSAVNQPADWQFGPVLVREWLTTGPDSVTLALIERLSPPLEGWDVFEKFSHVFNSSQTVSDMDRAIEFYEKLGFAMIMHHKAPLSGKGGEVLGLSPEQAPHTPVDLAILQPHGVMNGSVELVKVEGIPCRNVARKAMPFNLGLNLLRFPVSDLEAYATQLEKQGLLPVGGQILSTRLEPYGDTRILALQTPDGAWLEFYQEVD